MKAYRVARIFTGDNWVTDQVLVIDDDRITGLVPPADLPAGCEVQSFSDHIMIPAFIDVQVYGAAGRLFSLYPSADTLKLMADTFQADGTVLFLPTIATNSSEVIRRGIAAVRNYWDQGGSCVGGLHLEGPWINPKRKGAHLEEFIHRPTEAEVKELLEIDPGVIRMITLAPECCDPALVDLIRSHGIIVSAGHSDATYQQATDSFASGISTVTHLFNAMSPLHHREPGLVGATLDHHSVMASIIPDGHHVDFAAVRIAAAKMPERLFAITDAVTATTEGPYQHYLAGDKFECSGILSGSALSMHQAFKNLVNSIGLEVEQAIRMCSLYPARMLRCDDRLGKLEAGYKAKFLVLDQELNVKEVIS